ncbi:hypothetical protein D9_0107 [Aeromonas phage D9]|nr:hypothetical protein D9_0107 [Aeromonas phage D9]
MTKNYTEEQKLRTLELAELLNFVQLDNGELFKAMFDNIVNGGTKESLIINDFVIKMTRYKGIWFTLINTGARLGDRCIGKTETLFHVEFKDRNLIPDYLRCVRKILRATYSHVYREAYSDAMEEIRKMKSRPTISQRFRLAWLKAAPIDVIYAKGYLKKLLKFYVCYSMVENMGKRSIPAITVSKPRPEHWDENIFGIAGFNQPGNVLTDKGDPNKGTKPSPLTLMVRLFDSHYGF